MDFDKIGGRKFLLCVIMLVFAGALAATGKLGIDSMLEFFKWIFGFYIGGNLVQGATDRIGGDKPEI